MINKLKTNYGLWVEAVKVDDYRINIKHKLLEINIDTNYDLYNKATLESKKKFIEKKIIDYIEDNIDDIVKTIYENSTLNFKVIN